jgi:hypothetical protein
MDCQQQVLPQQQQSVQLSLLEGSSKGHAWARTFAWASLNPSDVSVRA